MKNDFTKQHCVPCEGGVAPLKGMDLELLVKSVAGWKLIEPTLRPAQGEQTRKISREFKFKNFVETMTFVNKVAALAEKEGHHPDIHISFNRVRLELTTHAIGGLSQNDFILAAKIDQAKRH